jgi:hypothetical protein
MQGTWRDKNIHGTAAWRIVYFKLQIVTICGVVMAPHCSKLQDLVYE